MSGYALLVPAGAAFAVAAVLLWLLLHLRLPIALDRPNRRSLHSQLVPRTGGLALLAGAGAGAAFVPWAPPIALVAVLVALAAVSFLDDLRGLPIAVRLACHLAAGAASAASLLWPAHGPGTVVAAAIAIAWMINAYNFMDGSDGMAGGMAVAGFAAYGWLGAVAGEAGLAAFCFSLAAAAAAFLLFNFHPARIFMGDAGSVPLGFLAATLGLYGWQRGQWSLWLPLILFSPFVADASVTLARRVLAGERFWEAHHDHYYQRLIRMGWSHRATALAAYGLMLGSAALGVAIAGQSSVLQMLCASGWFAFLGALMLAIELRWRRHLAPPR